MRLVGVPTEQDDEMNDAVRIAFATSDRRRVDQHFGSAEGFVVYAVSAEEAVLTDVAEFGDLAQDGNEDKLAAKLKMLEGCAAVYCQAVGASAIRQLLAIGVQPVKVESGAIVAGLIDELQQAMRSTPPPWLIKARSAATSRDGGRFDAMEAEGWSE
jgi:nitrogen fixation protein NifX